MILNLGRRALAEHAADHRLARLQEVGADGRVGVGRALGFRLELRLGAEPRVECAGQSAL